MNCFYCNGVDTMQPETIRFCVCDATPPLAVENVPAMVCQQCGEKDFSHETVVALEQVRKGSVRPIRHEQLRIFDYEQLRRGLSKVGSQEIDYHSSVGTGHMPQRDFALLA